MTESVSIKHLTITAKGERIDAECSHCGQGVDIPPMFGLIPAEDMLAAWIKQHTHKPKAKAKR